MKLTKLHFSNFKSLSDVTFEPGRVNVFVGSNGSGKTALLEALGLCTAAMSGAVNEDRLQRRGIRLSVPDLYRSRFRDDKVKQDISFQVEWQDVRNEKTETFSCRSGLGLQKVVDLRRVPDFWDGKGTSPTKSIWRWRLRGFTYQKNGETLFDRNQFQNSSAVRRLTEFLPLYFLSGFSDEIFSHQEENEDVSAYQKLKQYISPYGIYQPTTPILRGTIPDPNQTEPVGLNGGRLSEAVQKLSSTDKEGDLRFGSLYMDDVLEMIDWLEKFSVTKPNDKNLNANISTTRNVIEFQDRFMKPSARFTAYDASEGALYVLFLLTLAMHPDAPPVFAVDNFDQALNPRLARRLTATFCDLILEQEKQVFLTTHNPLVLDGLDLRNDDIRLFTVNRDSVSGKTRVERVELNAELMEKEYPASRLWVEGFLGGVPNL